MHIYSNQIPASADLTKQTLRKRSFEFINTESNRDNYLSELILRKTGGKYKIKLTHYSGAFDYAAFQSIWHFGSNEFKMAQQAFDTISYALDGIKERHNITLQHPTNLVPIIREAIKPVAEAHQYRKNILSIDESDLQSGESDWQQTVYGNRYPPYQEESKQQMLSNNHPQYPVRRTRCRGRNSRTTQVI